MEHSLFFAACGINLEVDDIIRNTCKGEQSQKYSLGPSILKVRILTE